MSRYLFKSERLGFRNWRDSDLEDLLSINQDSEVMRYFPSLQDEKTSFEFIKRMRRQYKERGYTYFAVEVIERGSLIGFIGLSRQDFDSPWTPFVDIGWRLSKQFWGKGYATEGAKRVLEFGFKDIELQEIYAVAPKINLPSIHIMKKVGMKRVGEFSHPKLQEYPKLRNCLVYKIKNKTN